MSTDEESGARFAPLWVIALWKSWDYVTWPRTVRELKRAGFRRTGFMTWEAGPETSDRSEDPVCYRTGLGFWVHGPGCTCPEAS